MFRLVHRQGLVLCFRIVKGAFGKHSIFGNNFYLEMIFFLILFSR